MNRQTNWITYRIQEMENIAQTAKPTQTKEAALAQLTWMHDSLAGRLKAKILYDYWIKRKSRPQTT